MVKHTQTIRRLNCLSVFDHYAGLAFKGLKVSLLTKQTWITFSSKKHFKFIQMF